MHLGARRRDERGSASIEMVVLLPALFAVLFLGTQAALYYHARTIAIAAAQEGARAAAAEDAHPGSGVAAARAYLNDVGGDALESSSASARRTTTTAVVTVSGRSLSVIPGWRPVVRQQARAEIERTTAPGDA